MKATEADIDHGWAWVVTLGVTLWNMLFCGILRSFGLLYVEMLDVFDARPGITSWVPGAFAISVTLIAPFSGYMSDRYSVRRMVLFSGIFGSLGFIITAYATSIYVAIVGYGIVTGSAAGMVDGPILAHLSRFFRKRRAVANGIAFAGSSIGTLVLPIIFAFLIEEYTVKGTFVITAGFWLHVCVVGMVLWPIVLPCSETVVNNQGKNYGEKNCQELEKEGQDVFVSPKERGSKTRFYVDHEIGIGSKQEKETLKDINSIEGKQSIIGEQLTQMNEIEQYTTSFPKSVSANNPLLSGAGAIFIETDLTTANVNSNNVSCHHLNDQSGVSVPMLNEYANGSQTEKEEGNKRRSSSASASVVSVLKLFTNWEFLRLVFFLFCGFFGYLNNLFLLPPYAKDIGANLFESSVIVSTAGFADLASRLFFGFLGDLSFVKHRRPLVANLAFFICGSAGILVPSFPTYTNTIGYAFVIGLFGGIFVVYMSSMVAETIGEDNIGIGMGVSAMALGTASSVGPPIFGWIKEATGSYAYGVRLCGGMYLLGGIVFACRKEMWLMMKDLLWPKNVCVRLQHHCRK